jgi:hypothetical protein
MSTDKQTNVGRELVDRLQNLNKMLDAIKSAQVDELVLPEINEHKKPAVKPKTLPKRNETDR